AGVLEAPPSGPEGRVPRPACGPGALRLELPSRTPARRLPEADERAGAQGGPRPARRVSLGARSRKSGRGAGARGHPAGPRAILRTGSGAVLRDRLRRALRGGRVGVAFRRPSPLAALRLLERRPRRVDAGVLRRQSGPGAGGAARRLAPARSRRGSGPWT